MVVVVVVGLTSTLIICLLSLILSGSLVLENNNVIIESWDGSCIFVFFVFLLFTICSIFVGI